MLGARDAYRGTLERRRTAVLKYLVIAEISVQEAIEDGRLSCKIDIEGTEDVFILLRHQMAARGYSVYVLNEQSKKGETKLRASLHLSWQKEPSVVPLIKEDTDG